jgi:hypothetical protein
MQLDLSMPRPAAGVTSLQTALARVLSAAHRRPHHQYNACSPRDGQGQFAARRTLLHATAMHCSHCPQICLQLI